MPTPTTYTYSVAQDTTNGKANSDSLTREIAASPIVVALSYIDTVGDILSIVMKDSLSEAENILLNNIVAAHTGVPTSQVNLMQLADSDGNPVETIDAKPMVSVSPGIDPTKMYYWQGSAGTFSVAQPYVEWQVDAPYVQMQGATITLINAEKGDKLNFEVGVKIGEQWVSVSTYGINITLLKPDLFFSQESSVISNPIPQGLWLRASYTFNNPNTANTPEIAMIYHLWRAYAS